MIAVYIILGLLVGFILAVILPRALLRKLERKDEGKEEGEGRYCTGHSPDLKLLRKYMHLVPPGFTSELSRRISSVCCLAQITRGQHILLGPDGLLDAFSLRLSGLCYASGPTALV